MVSKEMLDYVTSGRKRGFSDEKLRSQLVGVGWPVGEVDEAICAANHQANKDQDITRRAAIMNWKFWGITLVATILIVIVFYFGLSEDKNDGSYRKIPTTPSYSIVRAMKNDMIVYTSHDIVNGRVNDELTLVLHNLTSGKRIILDHQTPFSITIGEELVMWNIQEDNGVDSLRLYNIKDETRTNLSTERIKKSLSVHGQEYFYSSCLDATCEAISVHSGRFGDGWIKEVFPACKRTFPSNCSWVTSFKYPLFVQSNGQTFTLSNLEGDGIDILIGDKKQENAFVSGDLFFLSSYDGKNVTYYYFDKERKKEFLFSSSPEEKDVQAASERFIVYQNLRSTELMLYVLATKESILIDKYSTMPQVDNEKVIYSRFKDPDNPETEIIEFRI